MDRKDFKWLCADINKKVSAFRQLEKMDVKILSGLGQSACKVYILLEQIAVRADNKVDFRNRIEKEIIQAKRPFFQENRLNTDEIYLLEAYLKENFNALEDKQNKQKEEHYGIRKHKTS